MGEVVADPAPRGRELVWAVLCVLLGWAWWGLWGVAAAGVHLVRLTLWFVAGFAAAWVVTGVALELS